MKRVERWMRRTCRRTAVLGILVLATFLLTWRVQLGSNPSDQETLAYVDAAIVRALRIRAEGSLANHLRPRLAGSIVKATTSPVRSAPGSLFVRRHAHVAAEEEFKVGAGGETIEPVPGSRKVRILSIEPQTRWLPVGALLVACAAWGALLAWVCRPGRYDVFVSYDRRDSVAVEEVLRGPRQLGLRTWIDHELVPGGQWQEKIRQRLGRTKVAVICVGRAELGQWQAWEAAIICKLAEVGKCCVIPVILPGCEALPPELPQDVTWIDWRKKTPDPCQELVRGIDAA